MPIDYKSIKSTDLTSGSIKRAYKLNTSNTDSYANNAWWLDESADDQLTKLKGMIVSLQTSYTSRVSRYQIGSRLYGVMDMTGAGNRYAGSASFGSTGPNLPDRIQYNVVQSCCDTLLSRTSKIRPRARFLTNNGTFKEASLSKKLNSFIEGVFVEAKLYDTVRSITRDALVFGDGFAKVYSKFDRIIIERVNPSELYVDEVECTSQAEPTHMYHIKMVTRSKLMAAYPELAEKIASSQQLFNARTHATSPNTDLIEMIEGWKLGDTEDRKDGRCILAVPDCVLEMCEFDSKTFPVARLSWTQPFSGYWSQSLAEQLKSTQIEINKTVATIQRSVHLAGTFKILVANGSQIPTESFNNGVGTVIKYVGTPPQYITPPVVQPELYSYVETLSQRAYQISGISQLAAYSQKPAGLDSGVALREYSDIETQRFQEWSQDVESFYVSIAQICMSQAGKIAEDNKGRYPVTIVGNRGLEKVDFKNLKVGEESYRISVFPSSSLPNDPAGRLAQIDELIKRGLLDPVEQRNLLSFPDLEASNTLSTAQSDVLTKILEDMIENQTYTAPSPLMNLQLATKMALQYVALAMKLNEPFETIEMLEQFLKECANLQAPPPVPNLPAVELGAQASPQELGQLALPSSTGPLPGAEALVAGAEPVI